MATTTVEPKARKRRRKTRTKNVNPLPALVASELKASQIDLTPGKEHVFCPACENWTPITGVLGTPVLVPHHTTPYHDRTTTPRRCSNTNRRITLNAELDTWRAELAERTEVSASVASRRPTKVLPKPKTTTAPAASQLTPAPLSAEQVRRMFRQHQEQCLACRGEARDRAGQTLTCRDGERLAVTFLRLLRQEPKRQAVREFFARERHRFDREYAAAAPKREAGWAAVLPAVQIADQLRRAVPQGARLTEGPEVPLVPRPAAAQPEEGQLKCERCGATESGLVDAAAAGWHRITRRTHCGRCAQRFPAWSRTSF
ncbi:hypothetical protein AB0L28_29070 [Streptomyces sp. NPDC052503]|uniref:hypothetical protein n=1 Tax=Streptomyces sp. NPDC052503 TaxID=3156683 RepID=UPI00136B7B78|nr:hypothetical protein [Streptomyces sp. SID7834]MYT56027.1 hypothetical protein [Streptomyces sp. SID7834]MYT60719.1 hypothetical protein [Streptomyces sp. SID7834]